MLLNFSRKELSGLSSLRFGLSIYLLMFHTVPFYSGLPKWVYDFVDSGYLATSVFFLLSGFILSHVYLGVHREALSRRDFLLLRFLTLYPLHLVGLLLAFLLMCLRFFVEGAFFGVADVAPALLAHAQQDVAVVLSAWQVLVNFVLHVLLLQAWNPFYQTFNIPSWSVSALMFFYVAFVFVGQRLLAFGRPWLALLGLNAVYLAVPLVLIVAGQFNAVALGFLHTNPLVRLPEFLCGVVLYRIVRDRRELALPQPLYWLVLVLTCAGIYVFNEFLIGMGIAGYYLSHNGALLLLQCWLVAWLAGVRPFRLVWLNALIRRLGNASFSIFILHLPLFSLLVKLEKLLVAGVDGQLGMGVSAVRDVAPNFVFYPLYVVLVVLLSLWCQEHVVFRLRSFFLSGRR